MAYPTEVDAVQVAPTTGALGSTSPTHSVSHDQYRSGLLSIRDKISGLQAHAMVGLATGSGNAGANTTAIQAQLDIAEAAGGGIVFLPVGTYYINNTLNLGNRCCLAGCAPSWPTMLIFANGSSTHASPKPMIKAKDSTNYVGVMDLYLDGNNANQTDTTNFLSHGVDFATGRTATSGGGNPTFDGGLFVWNVLATKCQGDGFKLDGHASTMRVHDCYAYQNDIHGFRLKTDFIISDCVSAQNEHDFHVENGTSGLMTNLKAFGGTHGYKVGYSKSIYMSNCQAEDTAFTGFTVTASSHVTLNGCSVYRSTGSDNERSAFWIEDDGAGTLPKHVILRGCTHLSADFGTDFRYALWTRNLGTGCDFDIHTEGHLVAPRRFSTGSQAAKVSFNGETPETILLALGDETTTITTGTAKVTYRMPFPFIVDEVRANVNTASSSGVVTVDINEGGTTILSTKLNIDASEKTSVTAATAAVISDSALADDAEITLDVDAAGTGAKGLKVALIGRRQYP